MGFLDSFLGSGVFLTSPLGAAVFLLTGSTGSRFSFGFVLSALTNAADLALASRFTVETVFPLFLTFLTDNDGLGGGSDSSELLSAGNVEESFRWCLDTPAATLFIVAGTRESRLVDSSNVEAIDSWDPTSALLAVFESTR